MPRAKFIRLDTTDAKEIVLAMCVIVGTIVHVLKCAIQTDRGRGVFAAMWRKRTIKDL